MKAIAYVNREGEDFQGNPWIQTIPAGRDPEEELQSFFDECKPKKAVLFDLTPHLMPEISWSEVEKNKIKMLGEM